MVLFLTNTFTYDFQTETWSYGPSMNNLRRYSGCGMITTDDGSKVVVVAGGVNDQRTEFLRLDDPKEWVYGPAFSKPMSEFEMVQFENTVVAVGGESVGYLQVC